MEEDPLQGVIDKHYDLYKPGFEYRRAHDNKFETSRSLTVGVIFLCLPVIMDFFSDQNGFTQLTGISERSVLALFEIIVPVCLLALVLGNSVNRSRKFKEYGLERDLMPFCYTVVAYEELGFVLLHGSEEVSLKKLKVK